MTGEAARQALSVRVGLWLDEAGWVRQARWYAATDPVVGELAELACTLLEAGADPARLDGAALRGALASTPAATPDHAEVVAAAVRAALLLGDPSDRG